MVFEGKEIEIADEISDWSHIPVCENGEKLVKIPSRSNPRLLAESKYYTDILPGAIDGIWVRYTLLNMLEIASKMLPDNLKLLVWDGWRPTKVQMHLCKKAIAALAVDGARTNSSQEIVKYAANPEDVANKIPPHATGGAVDVCLLDSNGLMVEMGTPLDYFGSEAATAHLEKERERRELIEDELVALQNRRILYGVMTQAGFTNYPHEWWHFDFGNQLWGLATGKKALYGAIELPDV